MRARVSVRFYAQILGLLVVLGSVQHAAGQDTLWIVDSAADTVFHVQLDGTLISSFEIPLSGADSEIALDPTDGTLWLASESREGVAQVSKTGELLLFIPGTSFEPDVEEFETEGVAVAVDPSDSSLWVIDDATLKVYNLRKDGTLISSFPTSSYDENATSPQGIAVDSEDGTLWIADNGSDTIYNVTAEGMLTARPPLTTRDLFDVRNPQGVTSDLANGSLWFTARDTATIYNTDRDGNLLTSFPTSMYDAATSNPTGIAYDKELPIFVRGDANTSGRVNIADSMFVLDYVFRGGARPECGDAADSNGDDRLDLADPIYTLRYLFSRGPEPPIPGALPMTCGRGRFKPFSQKRLGCESFDVCEIP